MKKTTLVFVISLALLCSGCSTTRYRSYYPTGQVQQEYDENVVVGTVNGLFSGLFGVFQTVIYWGCGPRSNSAYYYTCPGH